MSGLIFGDNGTKSSLVVAANEMYFIDPGQSATPFNPATNYSSIEAARNTQLVFGYAKVEGMNRFVINAPAYIPEGYITSGQIGAIGFGKITDSNGQPVTTVSGKLKAQNIDVDNMTVANALSAETLSVSGSITVGQISDAGSLAGKNSVDYGSEVNGVKPPSNADKTGNHTAFDTYRVSGSSASSVRGWALDGTNARTKTDLWVRPNSTLIDGNKIFTGDAYVDTLEIKGNAVTIPGSKSSYGKFSPSTYSNYIEIAISLDKAGWVFASVTGSIFYEFGASESFARLIIDNTVVGTQGGDHFYKTVAMSGAVYLNAGPHVAYMQYKTVASKGEITEATIFIMGVKR